MPKPVMHTFIVNTGSLPTLNAHRIEAAYYKTEDGFTTFKDADNQAVFTVRDDHLVSVERADNSTPIADLQRLLDEADRSDMAAEGVFLARRADPDGRIWETTYEVQAKAVRGSVQDLETSEPRQVTVNVNDTPLNQSALREAVDRHTRRHGGRTSA